VNRLQRAAWLIGAPIRVALIGLIHLYRLVLSGSLGGQCRFSPTCSHYAEDAIREHGAIRGSLMAAWRIVRCGPFTDGGYDPVRPGRRHSYDVVIHAEASR
jgi:uncharacterized protein